MSAINACDFTAGSIPQNVTWFGDVASMPVTTANAVAATPPSVGSPEPNRSLHRLGDARRREGLTHHTVARQLGVSVDEVKRQEKPSTDLLLSELYRWQKVLEVPAAELLNEPGGELSPPVQLRANLLRIMKTARSIQDQARQVSIRRLAEMLVDQLVEIMPELKDTVAWPTVGHRRSHREFGQAFFRGLLLDPQDVSEPSAE